MFSPACSTDVWFCPKPTQTGQHTVLQALESAYPLKKKRHIKDLQTKKPKGRKRKWMYIWVIFYTCTAAIVLKQTDTGSCVYQQIKDFTIFLWLWRFHSIPVKKYNSETLCYSQVFHESVFKYWKCRTFRRESAPVADKSFSNTNNV